MTTEKWIPDLARTSAVSPGDLTTDWRARLTAQQSDIVERRKQALTEQSSGLHTAEERIRIWERLHALSMPADPAHPLVDLIAKATGLSLEQVHEEQQQRIARAAAKKAAASPKGGIFDPYCLLRDTKADTKP